MTDRLLRVAPIVVGLALGWLLVSPPDALSGLGGARHAVTAALVVLLLILFTAAQILANLPENITLEPLDPTLEDDLALFRMRLVVLGFGPAGPPLKAGIRPPATVVALVHASEPIYAAAYRTGHRPAKLAFDFVSILEGDRGGLTSSAEVGATILPGGPGSLRQVFRGQPPEQVLEAHRRALAYLAGRGLRARPATAAAFPGDFRESLRRQRHAFLARPLRATAVALWRVATGSSPHLGPVESQPAAQREIEEILSGRSAAA